MGMDFVREFAEDVLPNDFHEARESILRLRDVPIEEILEHLHANFLPEKHPYHYQSAQPRSCSKNKKNIVNEQNIDGAHTDHYKWKHLYR